MEDFEVEGGRVAWEPPLYQAGIDDIDSACELLDPLDGSMKVYFRQFTDLLRDDDPDALAEVTPTGHWLHLRSHFAHCATERDSIAAAERLSSDKVSAFGIHITLAEMRVTDFSRRIDEYVARSDCSDELRGWAKELATHARATSAAVTKARAALDALVSQDLGHVSNGALLATYDLVSVSWLFEDKIDIGPWSAAKSKLELYNRIVEQVTGKGYKELAQVPDAHLRMLVQLIDETLRAIGEYEIDPLRRSLVDTRGRLQGVGTQSAPA